jgi:pimeloyl-ACP methyl ester carboxylesterase
MHDTHPLPGTDIVVAGIRLHVTRHGRAGGALPALFVHGLLTSGYLWHDVMRDVGRSRLTIAADLVGLGRSERPAAGRYDLPAQAELLLGLLDEMELDRVAAVGHGLGAAVAVHLAALAPERVGALVLVDATLHADTWPPRALLPLLVPGLGELAVAGLRHLPGVAHALLSRGLGAELAESRLTTSEVAAYVAPMVGPDGPRGLLRFVRAVDLAAAEQALRIVAADAPPTLVLWGEQDNLHRPDYGRRVAEALPGAAWVPVSRAGHLLPQERPERVAEELTGFLADAVAPAP